MKIQVCLWTGHIAEGDPGFRFSFDNRLDYLTWEMAWLREPSYVRHETWLGEDD